MYLHSNLKLLISLMLIIMTHSVYATSYSSNSYTVSWLGTWKCNLDGRSAIIRFKLEDNVVCRGNICKKQIGTKLVGHISDNGGPWRRLERRRLDSNDPPASGAKDHILPLRYNGRDNWLLIMHTWNRKFASGYTTWRGKPYGLQCRKDR